MSLAVHVHDKEKKQCLYTRSAMMTDRRVLWRLTELLLPPCSRQTSGIWVQI